MVIDHFSKYLWACLLKTKEGSAIVEELDIIFHQFGFPELFHSDNGKNLKIKTLSVIVKKDGLIAFGVNLITLSHKVQLSALIILLHNLLDWLSKVPNKIQITTRNSI